MSDLLLNNSGDLDITNGYLSLIKTEEELCKQRISIKLNTYKGEWYLDLDEGVPYFQDIFKRGATKSLVDTILRSVIYNDPSVAEIVSFSSTLINSQYSLSFKAITVSGEIITLEQNLQL